MKKIILLSITTLFLTSCSMTLSPDSKLYKSAISGYSNHGKELYESKCAKCHDLPKASSFTAEEWKPILLSMQPKAKITDEQRDAIFAYVTTP